MKKGLWKRAAALSLAAIMGLSLAACGGDGNQDGGSHGGEDGVHSTVGTGGVKTAQAGKEGVYSFQELELIRPSDNVSSMDYQDGKLYLVVYNGAGSGEENDGEAALGYYKANADGSDSSFVRLKLPEREELYSWVNSTLISGGGYIYAVENSSYENTADPNNSIYEDRYYLSCWDMDGSLRWSKRMDTNNQEEWSSCSWLLDGGEGRALAIIRGDRNEAVLYSPQGEELERRELDRELFGRVSMMDTQSDGTLMLVFYNEEYTKRFFASYDLENGTLGEQYELPFPDNYRVSRGGDTLLLTDSRGLYTWSAGDTEPQMRMDIVNSDLPADGVYFAQLIDDRHFVALYLDFDSWEQKCAYFTYVDPADIADRQELVLGGMYISSSIRARVIEFNRAESRYRIILKDYSAYNTNEDWTVGQTRLNSDMISGQMPDIMVLDDMDSYVSYASKGALADIGELLEADLELSGEEYLQNVWDAYSVGGRLYAVIPSFNVRTMVAKKSLVGEPASWTMADVEAVLATMPEGASAFGSMTRESFFNQLLSYAGKTFIDVETGVCDFGSQGFMDMLEYAKTLPREDMLTNEEDYSYNENQYRENRSLMYSLSVSSIRDWSYQVRGYIGEEAVPVGFPTAETGSSTLSAGAFSFVISAGSTQKEGAWQFVRQFLARDYQTSDSLYEMPVLKSAFLERAREATERPYWIDADGSRQYYDDTWIVNGEEIILEPLTQAEVDAICEFIYTIDHTAYYNKDIFNIITEEAEPFFAGQKNVQEVAGIIQSRAQVYVDENR